MNTINTVLSLQTHNMVPQELKKNKKTRYFYFF